MEQRRIPVECKRPFKYLEIAQHVEDDEADKAKSRQRYDDFVPDRRLEIAQKANHFSAIIH